MTSFLKQLQDIAISRVKNTLFLTFVISWMTVNYDFVLTLLFSDIKIEDKINFIKSFPYSINKSLWFPLVLTLFYQLILPLLNLGLTKIKDKTVDDWIINHKNKTLKKHYERKKDVEKAKVELENISREYELKLKKEELKTEKELVDIEEFKEYQRFKKESKFPTEQLTDEEIQNAIDSGINESDDLSEEAKQLLIEASKYEHGQIYNLDYIGGSKISTNNKDFLTSNNPEEIAKWRGAIKELERHNFIEDESGKKELYTVTHSGYKVANELDNKT